MATRIRLDAELVRRELADSRDLARQLIAANRVQVNGSFAGNPGRLVDPGDSVELAAERARFVGRGGFKLERALDEFGIDVAGQRVLDAGASTGGFTDCLLQRGAREVVAVDVGYGQLHESLRSDPRVVNLERTNIRSLRAEDNQAGFPLIVADLSFMSVAPVIGHLVALAAEDATLILLVKPQFEASKQEADRGRGVIRDPTIWLRVLEEVAESSRAAGAPLQGATVSPIRGADGNLEVLFSLLVGGQSRQVDLEQLVADVVAG